MKRFASELIFLKRIKADGSGVEDVEQEKMENGLRQSFELQALSLTERTYIARDVGTYVVKLKHEPK